MVLSEDEVIVIVAVAESSSETFCGSVRKETLRKRSEMIHRVSWPRKAEAISIYYGRLWSLDSILLLFVLLHRSLANFCFTDRRIHQHQR